MRSHGKTAVVSSVCLVTCAGVLLGMKGSSAPSVKREDLIAKVRSDKRDQAEATSGASARLARAEALISQGKTAEAVDALNTIVRLDLPNTRAADKVVARSYELLGNLYGQGEPGAAVKAVSYYDLALQRMSLDEDQEIMARTLRAAAAILESLGRAPETGQAQDAARALESGSAVSHPSLGTQTSAGLQDPAAAAGDDTCGDASPVTPPHSEIMSVSFPGDANWRSFNLASGTLVRMETLSLEVFADDTTLTLYGGCSGTTPTDFIQFDEDGGTGFLSLLQLCLPPGDYFLRTGGFNNTSTALDFQLAITEVAPCVPVVPDAYEIDDELASATRIGFRNNGVGNGNQGGRDNSQIQSHTIFPAGDIDFVKFRLSRPNFVRIETAGADNPDTLIGLSNSGGQLLAINDDKGPAQSSSRLDLCLPDGDWYVPMIAFNPSDTFRYDVAVDVEHPCLFESEPNGTCGGAKSIAPGDTISGLQTSGGVVDHDWFKFTLTATQMVTIETTGWDPFAVDTFLILQDGCPGDVLAADDDSGVGFLSRIQGTLPAGTYYVDVTVSPFSVGSNFPYSMTLTAVNPPIPESEPDDACGSGNPALLGDTYTAAISPAGDRDNFTLTVSDDSFVQITTSGPAGDTVLKISSVDGSTTIGCDDDNGPGLFSSWSCCLPAGDYCVTVRDFGDNSTIPSYTVGFQGLGACSPSNPPVCPVSGSGCPF